MQQSQPSHHGGFNLVEVATSLGIIVVLLALLIPALSTARDVSRLQRCCGNQRHIGVSLDLYLHEHDDRFPFVPVQPAWHYGGVRFSAINGKPYLDLQRPLNHYLALGQIDGPGEDLFLCPADGGIGHPHSAVGTGRRTAYRSFGTSFRANAALADARIGRLTEEPRGMRRGEVSASPSRLVVMGDPVWYEVFEATGRNADWHQQPDSGNLLFLDGSVRFETIRPETNNQPVLFDPTPEHGVQATGG